VYVCDSLLTKTHTNTHIHTRTGLNEITDLLEAMGLDMNILSPPSTLPPPAEKHTQPEEEEGKGRGGGYPYHHHQQQKRGGGGGGRGGNGKKNGKACPFFTKFFKFLTGSFLIENE
jgi:hypothetical protein